MRSFFANRPLPSPFVPSGSSSPANATANASRSVDPPNAPVNASTKTKKLKILYWQQDGSSSPEEGLSCAKDNEADGVVFVDTRGRTDDRNWLYLAKECFGSNVFARSFKGLQQILGGSIGGTTVAIGNGWQRRCRGTLTTPGIGDACPPRRSRARSTCG